jgi:hypothetical protein
MEFEGKRAVRALVVGCAAAGAGVAVLVECRPTAVHLEPADPTSAVVVAAAWAAWLVAGGALLAIATAAAGMVPGRIGRIARIVQPLTPHVIRRVVEVAVGGAVVVAVATPVAAGAAPPTPVAARLARPRRPRRPRRPAARSRRPPGGASSSAGHRASRGELDADRRTPG